ncbi:hypothetical protein FJZ27_00895 [Candidatus Peribacteria bacterium]|nr:hypothetical protein [Candidatus Peribacteria bacterium]
MQSILAASAVAFLWFTPARPVHTALIDWTPMQGDRLVVDTEENEGYLVRSDNASYTSFPVITGQRRVVRYIGRTYNATTPNQRWIVKSRHIKGDRTTFGPTGRFLRMYKDGETYTSYGIHEHKSEERMFGEADRFQSMGCVIVQTEILDVIEETYELNGETLDVVTQSKIDLGVWEVGGL